MMQQNHTSEATCRSNLIFGHFMLHSWTH